MNYNDKKLAEYNTLRTELLSLTDRAYRAWRNGLIELGGLTAVIIANKESIKEIIPSQYSEISAFIVLSLIALLILCIASTITYRFERAADRLGSYLAVFHDTENEWHNMNRKEKGNNKSPIAYMGSKSSLYPLFFIAYEILLFSVITLCDSQRKFCYVIFFILLISFIIILISYYLYFPYLSKKQIKKWGNLKYN